MARLCIRIRPNPNLSDPSLDVLRTQAGDVVQIFDDTHQFSLCELNNGQYRILDVPGVPQEELLHLVLPVEDNDGVMTKRRAQSLDPAALKGGIWVGKESTTIAELDTITSAKAI